MNRLRRLGIALITIAVLTSAIFGPGAVTNLTADRTANVHVAGDEDAFVALEPADGPNGGYATQKDGSLRVSLDGTIGDGGGGGVNPDAETVVEDVFTITNNGPGPLEIWLTNENDGVTFEHGAADRAIERRQNAAVLEPGETIPVSIVVDTQAADTGSDRNLLESVRINADADVSDSATGESGSDAGDDAWEEWDGEAEAQETPDEDEFFEPTEEEENADDGLRAKAWGVVTDTYESVTSFADDPRGWLEDKYEWATDLSDSVVGGIESIVEDRSVEGIVDTLVDRVAATGGEAIEVITDTGNLKSFLAGALFGEMGMDGGFLETSLSDSTSYVVGSVAGALTPGWGFVSDTRDMIQNIADGELVDVAIDAAGLIISAGAGGANPASALDTSKKWVDQFSSVKKIDVANSAVTKLVPKLPGEKLSVRLFDQFTEGKKASQLNDAGLSDKQIASLMDSGTLKNADPDAVTRLSKQDGIEPKHIETFIKNDADLEEARRLADDGVPPDTIAAHVEDGGDLAKLEDSGRIVTDGGIHKNIDLSRDQEEYFHANIMAYDKTESSLRRSSDDVRKDIERLADDDVEGLDDAIRHATHNKKNPKDIDTSKQSGMQGLDGEVDVATSLQDDGNKIKRMEKDIEAKVDGETKKSEIDIDLEDGTGVEVKNTDYDNDIYKPSAENAEESKFVRKQRRNDAKKDLVKKINIATRNRDTYVIAHKTDDVEGTVLKEAVEDADVPKGSTVKLKHIDEITGD